MRIIINQPRSSYFVGGAEIISFYHAINFYKNNNDVYFFTINPRSVGMSYSKQFLDFKMKFSKQIKIVELNQSLYVKKIYSIKPGENRARWNVESIFYNQQLYDFLKLNNKKYDFMLSYYILDSIIVPRNYIKKNVLYLCGIPREQNDFQGSFLYSYDKIIAISDDVKNSWRCYAKNEIDVISTGVDFNRFTLTNNHLDKIRLLYVGRLISRKNVRMIIDAYDILKKDYNLELIIVGDGPEFDNLKLKSSDVIFTGTVNNPECYYKKSDIFISPSKYGEGLQGTIIEAMSSGLTIVASNTEVNRKLLNDGRGFLVEPKLDSLIDGIKFAIAADRKKISVKNRADVISEYNWDKKIKDMLRSIV